MIRTAQLAEAEFAAATSDLATLLIDAVAHDASVGFIRPLERSDAEAFWRSLHPDVTTGRLLIFGAWLDRLMVGTVQLRLAQLPNATHRAEVAKLLVHSDAQRRGIGRLLMQVLEDAARRESRSLLVLDTATGSDAERFYQALGWTRAGIIPGYARHSDRDLRPTTFYYKDLAAG